MAAILGSVDHLGGVPDVRAGPEEVRLLPRNPGRPRHAAGRRWSAQSLQELPHV